MRTDMEEILAALPMLLTYVPALYKVLETAFMGANHEHEDSWCENVPGLAPVCAALRDRNMTVIAAVHQILGDAGDSTSRLRLALIELGRRAAERAG
jgi:hypothetical protein